MSGQPSFTTALVFNVNVIMGSGALAIPYAFYVSGYALGAIVLALITFLSYVTISYYFESQVRVYALATAFARGGLRFHSFDPELRSTGESSGRGSPIQSLQTLPGADTNASLNNANADYQNMGFGTPSSPLGYGTHNGCPMGKSPLGKSPLSSPLSRSPLGGSPPIGSPLGASPGDVGVAHTFLNEKSGLVASSGVDVPPSRPPMLRLLDALRVARHDRRAWYVSPQLDIADPAQAHPRDYDALHMGDCWEINDLLMLLAGPPAVWAWNVLLIVFQCCTLWVFLVVIASTATLGIPLAGLTAYGECNTNDTDFGTKPHCVTAIHIWTTIFACINTGLVVQDWKFMPTMQKIFALLVYVCFGIILVTCLVAMGEHDYPAAKQQREVGGAYVQTVEPFKVAGFGILFGNAVFALLCHSATSFILRQMPSPSQTKRVFRFAFGGICLLYIAIGCTVSLYIGNEVARVATLNWSVYNEWGARGWFGTALGGVVLFIPILSVTPGFVLRTRSLTDGMETMVPMSIREWITTKMLFGSHYESSSKGHVLRFQVFLRVIVAVVAFTLAQISYEFEKAVTISGTAGFTILFFFPLLLQFRSRVVLRRLGFDTRTPFDDALSHVGVGLAILVVGTISFIYYCYANFIK
jgi:amino acid permease